MTLSWPHTHGPIAAALRAPVVPAAASRGPTTPATTRGTAVCQEGAPGWASDADDRARELELRWALSALEPFTGKRVLELGCGARNVASLLVARGLEVTGIDISPTAIAWAVERGLDRSRFLVGDLVEGIPGEHELVVDGNLLHCIIGEDRVRVLANVRGALVPRGCFFVCHPARAAGVLRPIHAVSGRRRSLLSVHRCGGRTPRRAEGHRVRPAVPRIKPREDHADQDHLLALVRKR